MALQSSFVSNWIGQSVRPLVRLVTTCAMNCFRSTSGWVWPTDCPVWDCPECHSPAATRRHLTASVPNEPPP